jgi:hypothetical protein
VADTNLSPDTHRYPILKNEWNMVYAITADWRIRPTGTHMIASLRFHRGEHAVHLTRSAGLFGDTQTCWPTYYHAVCIKENSQLRISMSKFGVGYSSAFHVHHKRHPKVAATHRGSNSHV